MWRRTWY